RPSHSTSAPSPSTRRSTARTTARSPRCSRTTPCCCTRWGASRRRHRSRRAPGRSAATARATEVAMPHRTLTLIDAGRPLTLEAVVHGDAIRLSPGALERALGWELKPEGLCRAGTCVPVRDRAALVHEDGIDLAALARLLDRPLALDAEEGIAAL